MTRSEFFASTLLVMMGMGALAWHSWDTNQALTQKIALLERKLEDDSLLARTSHSSDPEPSRKSAKARIIKTLEAKLSALSHRMEKIERSIQGIRLALPSGHTQPETTTAMDKALSEENEPPPRHWEHAENRYDEDTLDGVWASKTEAEVKRKLNDTVELQGLYLDFIECRNESCRLSWRYGVGLSNEDYFMLENRFMAALGGAGLASSTHKSDGAGGFEGYFFVPQEDPNAAK